MAKIALFVFIPPGEFTLDSDRRKRDFAYNISAPAIAATTQSINQAEQRLRQRACLIEEIRAKLHFSLVIVLAVIYTKSDCYNLFIVIYPFSPMLPAPMRPCYSRKRWVGKLDLVLVTNGEYQEFIQAKNYRSPGIREQEYQEAKHSSLMTFSSAWISRFSAILFGFLA